MPTKDIMQHVHTPGAYNGYRHTIAFRLYLVLVSQNVEGVDPNQAVIVESIGW